MKPMRVLIACEFSGTVRDAYTKGGHIAMSCDFLPSEKPGLHYQGDVRDILYAGWDLMIAHPPCTYLSAAGLHLCLPRNPKWQERIKLREEAVAFVKLLSEAPIPRIAIENPVGHLSTAFRKPDQIIYMNDFGHAEARKPTCLFLKNLPKLNPTNRLPLRRATTGKRVSEWFSKNRHWKARSKTFQGVADAMAFQWGMCL